MKRKKMRILEALTVLLMLSSFTSIAGTGWNGVIINKSSSPIAFASTNHDCWYPKDISTTRNEVLPYSTKGLYTEVKNSKSCNNTIHAGFRVNQFYLQTPNRQIAVIRFETDCGVARIQTRNGDDVNSFTTRASVEANCRDNDIKFAIVIEKDLSISYQMSSDSSSSCYQYIACIYACSIGKRQPKSNMEYCDENCAGSFPGCSN